MFNFIREGFIQLLDSEVDWMDEKTKSYAKEKAKAIIPHVGYNPHYQNATYLNESVNKVSFFFKFTFIYRLQGNYNAILI